MVGTAGARRAADFDRGMTVPLPKSLHLQSIAFDTKLHGAHEMLARKRVVREKRARRWSGRIRLLTASDRIRVYRLNLFDFRKFPAMIPAPLGTRARCAARHAAPRTPLRTATAIIAARGSCSLARNAGTRILRAPGSAAPAATRSIPEQDRAARTRAHSPSPV